jgi:hypothetical protein
LAQKFIYWRFIVAAPKRSRFQRELDLTRIARMHLEGMSQYEIAAELGLSQPAICRDLAEVNRRWRESSLTDLGEAKARELAKIDNMEQTAWKAWDESREESVRRRMEDSALRGKSSSITKETRVGNPAFLSTVQWCIEQRCKILGIYEAAKNSLDWRSAVEAQGLDASEVFEQMIIAYKQATTKRK